MAITKRMIDLHTHSNASDGTCSPTELVKLAKDAGLVALALTDHDSIDGVKEALTAGATYDIEVIPGVELSCNYNDEEIHMVGLFIDYEDEAFCEHLRNFQDLRDNRNIKMAECLCKEGFDISAKALYEMFPDAVLTRAHVAKYLVATGQVKELSIVFDKYIGNGCKCFVDRPKIHPADAIKMIHNIGGIAILAHPCLCKMPRKDLYAMIEELAAAGLDGIEAIYSCNMGSDESDFKDLAKKLGLLISGGSDFHGTNKPYIKLGIGKGNMYTDYDLLEKIKAPNTNYHV